MILFPDKNYEILIILKYVQMLGEFILLLPFTITVTKSNLN